MNSYYKIIAISGKPASGKQTLADDLLYVLARRNVKARWLRLTNTSLDAILEKIEADPDSIFIITDCQRLADAKTIQTLGGTVIRLNRSADLLSEKEELDDYDAFDFVYQNDSTTEAMLRAITRHLSIQFYWFN